MWDQIHLVDTYSLMLLMRLTCIAIIAMSHVVMDKESETIHPHAQFISYWIVSYPQKCTYRKHQINREMIYGMNMYYDCEI